MMSTPRTMPGPRACFSMPSCASTLTPTMAPRKRSLRAFRSCRPIGRYLQLDHASASWDGSTAVLPAEKTGTSEPFLPLGNSGSFDRPGRTEVPSVARRLDQALQRAGDAESANRVNVHHHRHGDLHELRHLGEQFAQMHRTPDDRPCLPRSMLVEMNSLPWMPSLVGRTISDMSVHMES